MRTRDLIGFLARGVLILAFIVAPLAWGVFELAYAGWDFIVIAWPEFARSIAAWAGDTVVWGVSVAEEAGWYAPLAVVSLFLLAGAGAYRSDWLGHVCCFGFWALGWVVVLGILRQLSFMLWSGLAFAASMDPIVSPSVIEAVNDGLAWLEANTSPVQMAGSKVAVILSAVLVGSFTLSLVRDFIGTVRGWVQSAFIGDVDPVFPRQSVGRAHAAAGERRKAINAFLNDHKLPPRHSELNFSNGGMRNRLIREYVVRLQEEGEVELVRAPEFLEVPKGSAIVAKRTCVEGEEEIVGQYVRLKFEAEPGPQERPARAAPEETLMLLLGRVVDAAVLADQHFDSLRDEQHWKAMPFFERIYVEYRPIPPPLSCFLGAFTGGGMPARVVVETQYPDVFRKALFGGGKAKRNAYGKWFGIGIQIERPNLPQDFWSRLLRHVGLESTAVAIERVPWSASQAPCRRLKSRVTGGVSGTLAVNVVTPPDAPAQSEPTLFHVMSSGPLADGCPSVMMPLQPRGAVANAPPMWLLPPQGKLHSSCEGFCVKTVPQDVAETWIDPATIGQVNHAASAIPRDFDGPQNAGTVRRRAWMGAFFDRDLRLANRFPLSACSRRWGGDGVGPGKRPDLRGAFVKDAGSDRFGGVFVAATGPEHASNLLLPQPLLNDYLVHLAFADVVIAVMPRCDEPPFVPAPQEHLAR